MCVLSRQTEDYHKLLLYFHRKYFYADNSVILHGNCTALTLKQNRTLIDRDRGLYMFLDIQEGFHSHIRARVLLNQLNEHLEQSGLLPESHCGFRKDRGTIDMIFTARQLQEKCQKQNVDLYMTFVDLTKAFETVSREGL